MKLNGNFILGMNPIVELARKGDQLAISDIELRRDN